MFQTILSSFHFFSFLFLLYYINQYSIPIDSLSFIILITTQNHILIINLKLLLSKIGIIKVKFITSKNHNVVANKQGRLMIYSSDKNLIIISCKSNRKIFNIIEDSKRTMKNFKKKQPKTIKLKELACKKPPPLQFNAADQLQFDQSMAIKTILSPTTNKLMLGFSNSQKKVISQQFTKMIKTLKKKLASPDKNLSQRNKVQTKTQRFEFVDPNNWSKQTIRKNIHTDRKPIHPLSPKTKNKIIEKECEILSPKKSKRNNSSACEQVQQRGSSITSPKKPKRTIKQNQNKKSSKKSGKLFKIKTKQKNQGDNIYYLQGENFVQIKENDVKQMESQILQQSGYQKDSELQFVWKQFLDEKKKLSRDRIQSQQQNNTTKQILPVNFQNVSSINKQIDSFPYKPCENELKYLQTQNNLSQNQNLNYLEPKQVNNQQLQMNSKIVEVEAKIKEKTQEKKTKTYLTPEALNCSQVESQCFNDNSPNPSPLKQTLKDEQQQDIIKMRTNAANLQIKTNREILDQLLKNGKIDKDQYQQHMDLAIQIYDKQMTDIQNLKEMIFAHQQKVDNLIKNTKKSLKISQKISEFDAKNVLQSVFGEYKKQNRFGQKSQISDKNLQSNEINIITMTHQRLPKNKEKSLETKWPINILDELQQYIDETNNPNSPIKSQSSDESNLSPKQQRIQQISTFEKFSQQIQENTRNIKIKIQTRMALQLGIMNIQPEQGIRTSVASVFQFIKNFFSFLKSFHLSEFLSYVNMPYGYSAQQRLKYMQGYDDQEDDQNTKKQGSIIYGLEQVIRPKILDNFHDNFYSKNVQNSKNSFKQYEKLHNKAIFDAINEALNQFRPYFQINGPPYLWTTTQKALTYYFIGEDCYEELLQKVQFQVLKWSSSLCGLIVPQAVNKSVCDQSLAIEQIFEKYTIQTDCELLQQRQGKIMKQQKIQIDQTYFQWQFYDQFQTALLYQISSCLLQDLATEIGIEILQRQSKLRICELFQDCGVSQSQIQI